MDAEFRRKAYERAKRGYDVSSAAAARGGAYAASDAANADSHRATMTRMRVAAIAAGDADPHPDIDAYFAGPRGTKEATTKLLLDPAVAAAVERAMSKPSANLSANSAPAPVDPAIAAAKAAEAAMLEIDARLASITGKPVATFTAERHDLEAQEARDAAACNAGAEKRRIEAADEDAIVARIAAA